MGLGGAAMARKLIGDLTNLQSLYLRCRFRSISPGSSEMHMVSNGCGTCNHLLTQGWNFFLLSSLCQLGRTAGILRISFHILFVEKKIKILLIVLCTLGSFLQSKVMVLPSFYLFQRGSDLRIRVWKGGSCLMPGVVSFWMFNWQIFQM